MRLFNRQKVLLKTIHSLNKKGIKSRTANVKSQFILKEEYALDNKIKFYNFFPYQYGPFSQLCYHDMRILKKEGFLNDDEKELTEKGISLASEISLPFSNYIEDVGERFNSEMDMRNHVYKKYPQYTVKSKLIAHEDEKRSTGITTIGYEGRDIDTFLNILIKEKIDIVIDVRRNPFSMNFSYVKGALKKYLKSVNIEYLHIPELGIESKERQELNKKEDYEKLFEKYSKELPLKEVYLNRIIDLSKKKRVTLLCYEKDPEFCHRGQIAKELSKRGFKISNF